MLALISLGLYSLKDISIRGLELAKSCDKLYFENYTSYFDSSLEEMKELFGVEVVDISREEVESSKLIKEASESKVGLLIIGDALSATTHISLVNDCKEKDIEVVIVHGSSVFSAVAETGLSLYNFGRVISIPFDNELLKKPYEDYLVNFEKGFHTLFSLDLKDGSYMTIKEALDYLIREGLSKDVLVIGCAGLGSEKPEIKVGKVSEVLEISFELKPRCLVIPGKLQFYEEEALGKFNK